VYGYNNALPVAVGANTCYKQMAFDNFEDYDFGCSTSGHFNYKNPSNPPSINLSGNTNYQKFAHSGRKAIKVSPGQNPPVKLTKDLKPCQ
jgi:hypothetical protein